ncbi:MAG TPA: SH3 domain-containing protein [Nitrospirota bacterium]
MRIVLFTIALIALLLTGCKTLDALDETSSKIITKVGGKPTDRILDAGADAASNALRGKPKGTVTDEENCSTICVSKASVRQSCNKNSKVLKTLCKNDTVRVIEAQKNWYLVEASDGTQGWVTSKAVKKQK